MMWSAAALNWGQESNSDTQPTRLDSDGPMLHLRICMPNCLERKNQWCSSWVAWQYLSAGKSETEDTFDNEGTSTNKRGEVRLNFSSLSYDAIVLLCQRVALLSVRL